MAIYKGHQYKPVGYNPPPEDWSTKRPDRVQGVGVDHGRERLDRTREEP